MNKRILALIVLTAMVALTVGNAVAAPPASVTIATAAQGGAWYPLGGAIGKIISDTFPRVQVSVAPGGGIANILMMGQGRAEMGFGFPADVIDARTGAGSFEGNRVTNVQAIAALYPGVWHMAARADSGINTIADLRGKRLAVPARGNTAEVMTRHIMAEYGLSYNDLARVSFVSYSDAASLMQDGHIDALVAMSTIPYPALQELAVSRDIKLIGVDQDHMEAFLQKHEAFMDVTVPGGSYNGVNDDVVTFGTQTLLLVREDLDEDFVYEVTKALFENHASLVAVTATMEQMRIDTAWRTLGVELHPGAARYYREQGAL